MAGPGKPLAGAATRREESVARVIDPARQRAEVRVQQLLDAARELMFESGRDFTLQDVVERSGLSLRSFYQYFSGKHELLLALFEDSIRRMDVLLRQHLDGVVDPQERLHRLLVEYYLLCGHGGRAGHGSAAASVPALAQFAQQLLSDHPREVIAAFTSVLDLFRTTLEEAAAAGVVRASVQSRRSAAFVLQTVMFNAFVGSTADGARSASDRAAAEEAWLLLFDGMRAA